MFHCTGLKEIPTPLEECFSTEGTFPLRRHLAMSEDILDCHSLGEWCYCHPARNVAKHLTMRRKPSYNAQQRTIQSTMSTALRLKPLL